MKTYRSKGSTGNNKSSSNSIESYSPAAKHLARCRAYHARCCCCCSASTLLIILVLTITVFFIIVIIVLLPILRLAIILAFVTFVAYASHYKIVDHGTKACIALAILTSWIATLRSVL